jgi:hypothetical protein
MNMNVLQLYSHCCIERRKEGGTAFATGSLPSRRMATPEAYGASAKLSSVHVENKDRKQRCLGRRRQLVTNPQSFDNVNNKARHLLRFKDNSIQFLA